MLLIVLTVLVCAVLGLAISLSRTRFALKKLKNEMQETRSSEQAALCERDEAKRESEAKDIYVQNMSHEVRTPLNAVVGFAQLLAMPPECLTQEERDEYSKHIQINCTMLTMLVDDILTISDVKGRNYSINKKDCLLSEICDAAMSSVKYRVKSGIELRYDTDIPEDFVVHTDARRVQQILINYLTNAIKHTRIGSIVLSTSLTEHKGMLTFAVTDTGEGVPVGQAKNVFHRFTKLNDMVQGTGLGLNICLHLAEKLGGSVFLDTSYIKGGARFVFCMPIQ